MLLRNPIEVMHAEHSTRLQCCIEQIRDFGCALDSSAPRIWKGREFRGQVVQRPTYRELVQFSEQLQRYFRVFGRERIHVTIYDDLLGDPSGVYRSVLGFLELIDDGRQDFHRVNANRRVKSMAVQEFLEYPGAGIRSSAQLVMPKTLRAFAGGIVRRLNVVEEPRSSVPPLLKRRLIQEFEPELRSLSNLLGRNLSAWCKE